MTRWNATLAAIAALAAGLAGCRQQCFMSAEDYNGFTNNPALVPPNLASDLHDAIVPGQVSIPKPMDVTDTNREVRYISLSESIAMSLENGNVGSQSPLFPGVVNDSLVAFSGASVAGSDAVRVLALEPAIVGSNIESALSRFDARSITSMTWQKTDQAIANGLASFQNGDSASFSSGVFKFLPAGGLAGITYNMNYTFLTQPPTFNNTPTVNPSYRPQLQFLFEQPLLQFFGVEINQISPLQPGSVLVPGLKENGTRTEGILITRLRFDQQRAEFERNVNYMILNVEYAYWNLYGAYYTLFSREQGLRYALVSWQVNDTRYRAGRIAVQDLEQTRAQYELFRAQRFTALGRVLDAERQLRGLIGLPVEDGKRLVPSDAPVLAAFTPDWPTAVNESLALRPEMVLARQDLKFRQLDLIAQKNALKPDLRFFATYDINGLGTRLDGGSTRFAGNGTDALGNPVALTEPGNALKSIADNKFNSWELGLRMDVPIGFRDAHAAVRSAQLNLKRSYFQLKDTERKAISFLTLQERNVIQYYNEMQAQHAQREANAKQLLARFEAFNAGTTQGTIDILLEAQRNWADSLASEYTAIVNYNTALAGFQFAKGTILPYDNVSIAEGALPQCVQVRAVEHIRERQKALELRERPDPAVYEARMRGDCPVPDAPPTLVGAPMIQVNPPPSQSTGSPPYGLPVAPMGPGQPGETPAAPTAPANPPPAPPQPPGAVIAPAPLVPFNKPS
ncbi:MAG TPA: TolC family protein [Gemmataceae bacterium]|nr:TolC family protein [Gemmataceae bacterium]